MFRLFAFLPKRWWSPQAWKTWASYVHWRMETYGVYGPDGKSSSKAVISLLRQFPSYYRWLGEMNRNRRAQPRQQ